MAYNEQQEYAAAEANLVSTLIRFERSYPYEFGGLARLLADHDVPCCDECGGPVNHDAPEGADEAPAEQDAHATWCRGCERRWRSS
jgi:hypothetical protein